MEESTEKPVKKRVRKPVKKVVTLKVEATPLRTQYFDACLMRSSLQAEIRFVEESSQDRLRIKGKNTALTRIKNTYGIKATTRKEALEQMNALIKELQAKVQEQNKIYEKMDLLTTVKGRPKKVK